MELFYPFFVAFSMIFFAELGDKTQLLVLSFSGKGHTFKILLGILFIITAMFLIGVAIVIRISNSGMMYR